MGNVRENKEYFLGKKMELLISFAVRTSQKKKKRKEKRIREKKYIYRCTFSYKIDKTFITLLPVPAGG